MADFSHLDEQGKAQMVDVSYKTASEREAVAMGEIVLGKRVYDTLLNRETPKGDVIAAARIAGIMAAKKTAELIPLCHQINLNKVTLDFEYDSRNYLAKAVCTAKTRGITGVEMEALTGVSVALLTIYDMCKALDKGMLIQNVCLLEKSGGKSGHYERLEAE